MKKYENIFGRSENKYCLGKLRKRHFFASVCLKPPPPPQPSLNILPSPPGYKKGLRWKEWKCLENVWNFNEMTEGKFQQWPNMENFIMKSSIDPTILIKKKVCTWIFIQLLSFKFCSLKKALKIYGENESPIGIKKHSEGREKYGKYHHNHYPLNPMDKHSLFISDLF